MLSMNYITDFFTWYMATKTDFVLVAMSHGYHRIILFTQFMLHLPRIEPSVLLLSSSPPKNSQNLRNPLWRALASKPLNQLSSVTPFYKWEAMSFHHILLDLVSDFGKGPKRGFKKTCFKLIF